MGDTRRIPCLIHVSGISESADLTVNDVPVIQGDIAASNGVIHIIGEVLEPGGPIEDEATGEETGS